MKEKKGLGQSSGKWQTEERAQYMETIRGQSLTKRHAMSKTEIGQYGSTEPFEGAGIVLHSRTGHRYQNLWARKSRRAKWTSLFSVRKYKLWRTQNLPHWVCTELFQPLVLVQSRPAYKMFRGFRLVFSGGSIIIALVETTVPPWAQRKTFSVIQNHRVKGCKNVEFSKRSRNDTSTVPLILTPPVSFTSL